MKKYSFQKSNIVDLFPTYKTNDLFPFPENVRGPMPQPKHNYDKFYISVFDHQLSEEEYETQMLTFPAFGKVPARPCHLWKLYKNYEDRFRTFYEKLYKYGLYMIFRDKYLAEFNGIKEYRRYYMYDVREINRWHTYVVPSLGVLVSGNFDLTHIVHANKEYYKKEEFEKIAKDSGLYILR